MPRQPSYPTPDLLDGASDAGSEPRADDRAQVVRGDAVLPVSLLVSSARVILERRLGLVWVAGEISNFTRATSGHCYFNLKDAQAQVRCVYFRHKAQFANFSLRDGLQVEVRAVPSIFEPRGEFQLNVETLRLAGIGALYEKFARLKAKLEAAGWFAEERKRPLPAFPHAVGVVTSAAGAALRDVLTTLRRRWPRLRVVIYPTSVQGPLAAPEIARAIRTAGARAEVDALIVCRGGGSIEDLWAFNEEAVARAIVESPVPIISGVGHETDFTICDFVADVRAPTPTAAAERACPDRRALARELSVQVTRWLRCSQRHLEARMQRVDATSRRLVHPAARLERQARETKSLARRLAVAAGNQHALRVRTFGALRQRIALRLKAPPPQAPRLATARNVWQRAVNTEQRRRSARLEALTQNLAHLNPLAVLERGYSIVTTPDGRVVQDTAQVAPGDAVALTFAHGSADAKIETVKR